MQPFRAAHALTDVSQSTDHSPVSAIEEDRQVVERFLSRRSIEGFQSVYRRHQRAVYRFALRLSSGLESAAEEVAQETWVRAIERLESFDFRSSLRTWLIGIALNCWREQLRREQRHRLHLVSAEQPEGRDDGPLNPVANRESVPPAGTLRLELLRALDRLPNGYREVVLLHDVEGLTHEEVAELLGISSGTSKSQLSHARRALRGLLDSSGDGRSNRNDGGSR